MATDFAAITELTQDQKDFIRAVSDVAPAVGRHVMEQIIGGATFDEVQASLRRAVACVDGWRIGRGV
jgi:hypothetical protein